MNKKVILITGASSGIGKDAAKALVAQGHTVYVAARRIDKMADLQSLGCISLQMDITQEKDIQAVVNTIMQNHSSVDVLCNNAGFGLYGAMEDILIDEARYQFEVNLFGLARLTQLLLPGMRAKKAGRIINISSIVGKMYLPLGSWYIATKHALEGWSDCLRLEVAQFGIDVVIVEPGAIKTEFADVSRLPMIERSGQGAYSGLVQAITKLHKKEHKDGGGSDPQVITKIIVQAVNAKKTKTRYAAGKYSGSMLFLRRWLSDRMFDKLLISIIKPSP
ncbi:short-chain dehydrogenase [Achromatium sp. WMS3]|nr:short-chain dehydrogenase [Achromatium sp. WMS3]